MKKFKGIIQYGMQCITRKYLCLSILVVVVSSFTVILFPLAEKKLINTLTNGDFRNIEIILVGIIGITVLQIFFSILSAYILSYNEETIGIRIQRRVIVTLFQVKYDIIEALDLDYLHSRIKEDSMSIAGFTKKVIDIIFSKIFIFIISNIYIGINAPIILFLLYTLVGLFIIMYMLSNHTIRNRVEKFKEVQNNSYSRFNESLDNLSTIQVHSWGKQEEKKLDLVASTYLTYYRKLLKITTAFLSFASSLQVIFSLIVLISGTFLIEAGKLSIGELIALISFSSLVISPVVSILELISNFPEASISFSRLKEIELFEKRDNGKVMIDSINKITLRLEQYGYLNNVIHGGLNLEFEKGNIYLIEGENGEGKSTLLKILSKLHFGYSGSITINDNIELRQISDDSFYNRVSYIEQDSHLFNTSINNNIFYENSNLSERIPQDFNEFMQSLLLLPEGLNTKVINNVSSTISGGERQKIAIVRELVRDSDVLILDEPISSLDAQSTLDLMDILKKIKISKIIIIVSHNTIIKDICDFSLKL